MARTPQALRFEDDVVAFQPTGGGAAPCEGEPVVTPKRRTPLLTGGGLGMVRVKPRRLRLLRPSKPMEPSAFVRQESRECLGEQYDKPVDAFGVFRNVLVGEVDGGALLHHSVQRGLLGAVAFVMERGAVSPAKDCRPVACMVGSRKDDPARSQAVRLGLHRPERCRTTCSPQRGLL